MVRYWFVARHPRSERRMKIEFFRSGPHGFGYMSWAHRDDGVVVQIPGPGLKFNPPHDLAHYVVERVYAPVYGFWGIIASGAVWGDMHIIAGRRPPHSDERTKEIRNAARDAQSSAEGYVFALQEITDRNLDHNWPAVQAILAEHTDYRTNRPTSLAEVQQVCASLRDAARQWTALGVGEKLTVHWHTAIDRKGRRSHDRRRRAHRH
jgi:hypothetical protein